MTHFRSGFLILATLPFAAAESAYGQNAPPDVVTSAYGNTAMGSSALMSVTFGEGNTAVGSQALESNTQGNFNTAVGESALVVNSVGNTNTAIGAQALGELTTGFGNTAVGYQTIFNNNSGIDNTAVGADSLANAFGGNYNVALGVNALELSGGNGNTATGTNALFSTTTGNYNTATGVYALCGNEGSTNTAFGAFALSGGQQGIVQPGSAVGCSSGTSTGNTASGAYALSLNTTGGGNTAVGVGALQLNTIGGNNTALGAYAGSNITSGWRNIDIDNLGEKGDAGIIRVGTSGKQFATYIAGISGVHLTGSAVYISSSGQLGVLASSERYKTSIEPMARRTEKLKELRPVTFHLKTDPKGDVQYGLIAEEVAQVYPELVIRDEKGQVEGVRYEELAPMLLNEVQKQNARIGEQASKESDLEREVAELKRANDKLQAIVGRYLTDEQVAER